MVLYEAIGQFPGMMLTLHHEIELEIISGCWEAALAVLERREMIATRYSFTDDLTWIYLFAPLSS